MSLTEFQIAQIARRSAEEINEKIDRMVKAIDFGGPVPLSPIEEERRRVMHSTFSGEQGEHNAVNFDRDKWGKPEVRRSLFDRITKLFESGDARKIASAHVLTKTYDRLKAADVTDICVGIPGCELDHEGMSPDEFVRHVEG